MHLVLTLDDDKAGSQAERRFDAGSFRIGRDDDNDWTLPDPNKLISRQHCLIERRDGGYWLSDLSSNGTYMNDAADDIGDHPVRLSDGDRIRLGGCKISLRIEDVEANAGDAKNPFGFDQVAPDGEREPETPIEEPKKAKTSDPLSVSGVISTSWLDKEEGKRQMPTPQPEPARTDSGGFFDDFVPPQKEHYNVFERRPPLSDGPVDRDDEPDQDNLPSHDPFAPAPESAPDPAPSGTLLHEPASEPAPRIDPEASITAPEETAPVRQPPQKATESSPPAVGDGGDGLRAFMEGAGIADTELSENEPPEAVLRRLGENYAVMADGLRQLLNARAAVKGEAGLEQTKVGGSGNNPLKTSVRTDEAVLSLVMHKGPGYLAPRAAIEAALSDLKAHEVAMLDGMQAALKGLLKRLSPTSLEQQLRDESSFKALMAGGRNAMYWRLLKERYAEIAERSEQRFMGDFDREFARAYQRRSNSL